MGRYIVKLPDIGEGTTEAEIVKWHVTPGQEIREEDPLVDVMTDKATVEIPAPVAGTVVAVEGGRREAAGRVRARDARCRRRRQCRGGSQHRGCSSSRGRYRTRSTQEAPHPNPLPASGKRESEGEAEDG